MLRIPVHVVSSTAAARTLNPPFVSEDDDCDPMTLVFPEQPSPMTATPTNDELRSNDNDDINIPYASQLDYSVMLEGLSTPDATLTCDNKAILHVSLQRPTFVAGDTLRVLLRPIRHPTMKSVRAVVSLHVDEIVPLHLLKSGTQISSSQKRIQDGETRCIVGRTTLEEEECVLAWCEEQTIEFALPSSKLGGAQTVLTSLVRSQFGVTITAHFGPSNTDVTEIKCTDQSSAVLEFVVLCPSYGALPNRLGPILVA